VLPLLADSQVAILCNHQRTVSKAHAGQMEKLQTKVSELEVSRREAQRKLNFHSALCPSVLVLSAHHFQCGRKRGRTKKKGGGIFEVELMMCFFLFSFNCWW